MDELEDDAGYSDACEYEWELEQVDLLLQNDPDYPVWVEYTRAQHEIR